VREHRAVAGQGFPCRALRVEQAHFAALRIGQPLAVAAPAQSRRPARRVRQQAWCGAIRPRVPQPYRAVLSRTGQYRSPGLPGQLQHAGRMLAELTHGTVRGLDEADAPFTAADGQLSAIRRPGKRHREILDGAARARCERGCAAAHGAAPVRMPRNPGTRRAAPRDRACGR
jgi:hypothetical protein